MPATRFAPAGLALVAAALLPLVLTGCGSSNTSEAQAGAARGGGRVALVRVTPAEQRTVSPKVFVVGTVVPVRTSIVASGSDGVVTEYDIDDGQYVEPGTVLSVLLMKSTDLEIAAAEATLREREELWKAAQKTHPAAVAEAQAQLLTAETIAEFAAKTLDRAHTLFEQNALNREGIDSAQETARSANAALEAARAAVERVSGSQDVETALARYEAQREQVEFLKAEKEKRTTRAPFAGFVVQEHTYVGQWLSKGDPIVTLARLDEVDVIVNVDQWDLRHVRVGEQVTVSVRGTSRPEWRGTVVAIVPRSDWQQGSRGFPVKVRLQNEFHSVDGRTVPLLNEGMMAEVTFEGEPLSAVVVPKDALVRTTHGMNVFVFQPETAGAALDKDTPVTGRTLHLPVEVGLSDGAWVEVRPLAVQGGPGQLDVALADGTLVVTEGGENLQPPVQPGVQARLK
ncbi:MAG TPA: HlyD family efflux transporter periplasmic adaptor subunit [Planctomycetaceae bacterium]|nr:HlyD family efflux transporter periplasmic adaptor subunit [Planctomycetaceae bacterium]